MPFENHFTNKVFPFSLIAEKLHLLQLILSIHIITNNNNSEQHNENLFSSIFCELLIIIHFKY